MKKDKAVLTLWVESELMRHIDEYQHENRYQFRSDAVKSLLRQALGIKDREEVKGKDKSVMAE